MANLANGGSITTDVAEVAWADTDTIHNFVVMNINDGPVRITVTPNNGLEFASRQLGHGTDSINHHTVVGESFVLEGDTGILLRLQPSAVDSTTGNNTVTFSSEDLHTGIRNEGSTLIALQVDVSDNSPLA